VGAAGYVPKHTLKKKKEEIGGGGGEAPPPSSSFCNENKTEPNEL